MAEFAASLEWQIAHFLQVNLNMDSEVITIATLISIYLIIFLGVMFLEKRYKEKKKLSI